MVQAARSGKKNIPEGSKAAQTSKEMEIKLTNVARASLEEPLDGYRDYLRVREHPAWDKNSREAPFVRKPGRFTPHTHGIRREFMETRPPETIAICLIHQTNHLIEQGGLRERMTRVRLASRNGKQQ